MTYLRKMFEWVWRRGNFEINMAPVSALYCVACSLLVRVLSIFEFQIEPLSQNTTLTSDQKWALIILPSLNTNYLNVRTKVVIRVIVV